MREGGRLAASQPCRNRGRVQQGGTRGAGRLRRGVGMERLVWAGLLVTRLVLLGLCCLLPAGVVKAQTIQNPVAVFAALDKVTGRISHLEIQMVQTVQFGALRVTPRVCHTRPPTEA